MKAEYANVFIKSAAHVFQKELGVTLSRESLARKDSPIPGLPISIILGITGSMRGQVVYAMDQGYAEEIAKVMVPGMVPNERRKLINSAVGEIGNMVTGQASIYLAGQERVIYLTPPTVFTGKDIQIDFLKIPTLCLRLLSVMGVLEINVALSEAEDEI